MGRKINIKNENDENLVGILEKNNKTNEIIIICHGSESTKNSKIQSTLAKDLKSRYNTFRFDFSGKGESEGKLEDSTYTKDINDLFSVIDFLKGKKYKIGAVIGYSKSGTEALLAAKELKLRSVEKIIAIAPRIFLRNAVEMQKLRENEISFKKQGYYVIDENSKIKHKINENYIKDLKKWWDVKKHYKLPPETIIIHGMNDKIIDIEESEKFIKKFKLVNLVKISGAGHGFDKKLKKLSEEVKKLLN